MRNTVAMLGRLVIVAGLLVVAAHLARADECPAAGLETATVAAVEPRLELRLTDGRLLRLAGLDPAASTPDAPDLADTTRGRLATLVAGRSVSLRLLSSALDRWGRRPAFVFRPDDPPGGLAAAAVAAGLGRYLAEPAAHPCRADLLSAEAQARQAKLGLWGDPYYSVLAVDDDAAFAERAGTTVVMEGRLRAVESGPYRTKLRFAAPGSHGRHVLSATLLPRVMKVFEAQGVTFDSLIGSTVRLRGLLDLRFGPEIDLSGPDELEVVAAPTATVR